MSPVFSEEWFYDLKTLDGNYQLFDFGFESDGVIIANDGTGIITFSWNGREDHGIVKASDPSIAFDGINQSKVFLKTDIPGDDARVYAWTGSKY